MHKQQLVLSSIHYPILQQVGSFGCQLGAWIMHLMFLIPFLLSRADTCGASCIAEQRRDMRDISRGMGPNRNSREDHGKKKKRKHDLAEKQSVAAAAAAFLAEAQKELFGERNLGKQKEDEESEEGEIEGD
jgi:hypothetical protein